MSPPIKSRTLEQRCKPTALFPVTALTGQFSTATAVTHPGSHILLVAITSNRSIPTAPSTSQAYHFPYSVCVVSQVLLCLKF